MRFAHYHPDPSPHVVMDAETWEVIKSTSESVGTDPLRSSVPAWMGTPVYVDRCPELWDCETYGDVAAQMEAHR